MYIVGDIGDGHMGNLSKEQALKWLLDKDGRTSSYALEWKHHDWSALRNVNQISLD